MTVRSSEALRVSNSLMKCDDNEIRALIESGEQLGVGIGGETKIVGFGDETVFAKLLPLAEAEEPDPTCTTSQLQLPFTSHYGFGCPAAGIGREPPAHQMTSQWVQIRNCRLLSAVARMENHRFEVQYEPREFQREQSRRQWGSHWPQVDQRLRSLEQAFSSMVLFLEYFPETLSDWLRRRLSDGFGSRALSQEVNQILSAAAWMPSQGFLHFDVNPAGNILVK